VSGEAPRNPRGQRPDGLSPSESRQPFGNAADREASQIRELSTRLGKLEANDRKATTIRDLSARVEKLEGRNPSPSPAQAQGQFQKFAFPKPDPQTMQTSFKASDLNVRDQDNAQPVPPPPRNVHIGRPRLAPPGMSGIKPAPQRAPEHRPQQEKAARKPFVPRKKPSKDRDFER
jgi:hypothetical protein